MVIAGTAQGSVDPPLLQDLYVIEFIVIASYTLIALGHGVIRYYHQKSKKTG